MWQFTSERSMSFRLLKFIYACLLETKMQGRTHFYFNIYFNILMSEKDILGLSEI